MDKYLSVIENLKNIFSFFEEAYVFGSVLYSEYPNDIDILLIYNKYSDDILKKQERISEIILNAFNKEIVIDVTVLSKNELEQTRFLENTLNFYKVYPSPSLTKLIKNID